MTWYWEPHRISDVAEPVPAEQNVTESRLHGLSTVNRPGAQAPLEVV